MFNNEEAFCIKCRIENLPTADVVPRSEVEKIFDKYGNYNFPTDPKENFNNTVTTSGQESIDFYCSFTKSKIQECPIQDEVEKAKQEVAREIFEEIEYLVWQNDTHPAGELTEEIAELKKKYIGE